MTESAPHHCSVEDTTFIISSVPPPHPERPEEHLHVRAPRPLGPLTRSGTSCTDHTHYWCKIYRALELTTKHHMIGLEPLTLKWEEIPPMR